MTDSIPKYVTGIDFLELHCFPGTTLGRLVAEFARNAALKRAVTRADYVIIHCGTNDIHNLSPDCFPAALNNLFACIKRINPAVGLLYSAMLPRPVDIVKRVNRLIMFFVNPGRFHFFLYFDHSLVRMVSFIGICLLCVMEACILTWKAHAS